VNMPLRDKLSTHPSVRSDLTGSKVVLRAPEPSDLPFLVTWSSDPEIRALTAETEPLTRRTAPGYLRTVRKDRNRLWYVIVDRETGRPVGECGLLRIFWPWKTADLTMIIGEKEYWGRGFADEAMGLLLELAFTDLGLHRLAVGVLETNGRALKFYSRHGFREEGRQREGHFRKGRYHDFVMMSLLKGDCGKRRRYPGRNVK